MKSLNIIILAIFVFINSCANKEDNKFIGQILGSAAGVYLGSKVGSDIGRNFTVIIGGAVGYLVGGKIAEILNDEDEEDFNNKISDSLDKNKDFEAQEWKSSKNKNVNGEIIPLNNYQIEEKTCRDFKKIVKINGKKIEEDATACRDEDGNWKII